MKAEEYGVSVVFHDVAPLGSEFGSSHIPVRSVDLFIHSPGQKISFANGGVSGVSKRNRNRHGVVFHFSFHAFPFFSVFLVHFRYLHVSGTTVAFGTAFWDNPRFPMFLFLHGSGAVWVATWD